MNGLGIFALTVSTLGGFAYFMSLKLEKESIEELSLDFSKFKFIGFNTDGSITMETVLDLTNKNDQLIRVRNLDLTFSLGAMQFARLTKPSLEVKPKSVAQIPMTFQVKAGSIISALTQAVSSRTVRDLNIGAIGRMTFVSTTLGAGVNIDVKESINIIDLIRDF